MNIDQLIENSEKSLTETFKKIDSVALYNQEKVLSAFKKERVALRHFAGTTGYGYDDIGRDTLGKTLRRRFHTESAIGVAAHRKRHTRHFNRFIRTFTPRRYYVFDNGRPYDTLMDVIGGNDMGSLKEYGVTFEKTELNGCEFDKSAIAEYLGKNSPKMIFIQRSRGYSSRDAFTVEKLGDIISFVRKYNKSAAIVVDNCYGEFVETTEPTDVGADIVVGSLIKNPGGGLAPTGGYIAGKEEYVRLASYRLTCPGIGTEVGSYISTYQYFYQGLFMAPHTVAQTLKAAQLFCQTFASLGYPVVPEAGKEYGDIIASIKFNTEKELVGFVQAIQTTSPVDSFVVPEPWDMPGYNHKVIMAAGTFVQGASVEMSADSPIKEPYIAYFQGALTYEHAKIALKACLEKIL